MDSDIHITTCGKWINIIKGSTIANYTRHYLSLEWIEACELTLDPPSRTVSYSF